jgi:hypothetical protein
MITRVVCLDEMRHKLLSPTVFEDAAGFDV